MASIFKNWGISWGNAWGSLSTIFYPSIRLFILSTRKISLSILSRSTTLSIPNKGSLYNSIARGIGKSVSRPTYSFSSGNRKTTVLVTKGISKNTIARAYSYIATKTKLVVSNTRTKKIFNNNTVKPTYNRKVKLLFTSSTPRDYSFSVSARPTYIFSSRTANMYNSLNRTVHLQTNRGL